MRTQTEKYFDKASHLYDESTKLPTDWYAPIHLSEVLNRHDKTYENVLVIGTGTGQDVDALLFAKIESVTMIDISSKMLEIAKIKHPSVRSIHADFTTHNFELERYDLIVCLGVLEFIENIDMFFRKTTMLLDSNGVIFVTYEPHIINHPNQCKKTSTACEYYEDGTLNKGVTSYRRDIHTFIQAFTYCDLKASEYSEYIAYTFDEIILYHFAILEKRLN